ncbi:MAG: ATP-dependent helicase, partial [Candidatus Micrarchaeota archaeon]|nr:ATP-dependent helicase [Candidatus Micrarchaeota archaeon]
MTDEKRKVIDEILSKPKPLKDPSKKAAITTDSRFVRVIAGAGAGKTETLTRRIAYLLLVEKVPPNAIVAFTFTEKAAAGMKERIYERVGGLDESMIPHLGEMYIGTIHAYAKRLLEDHFGYGMHTLLDENQEIAFLLRHGWNLGLHTYDTNYTEACRAFLRSSNMVLDELLDQKKLKENAPEFFAHFSSYHEQLDRNHLLTFGRVIFDVVRKLQHNPEPVAGIKHLIVDEYQDINRSQAELIGIIGKTASVFVVGDPRQSIYQWRGSNEFFFGDFERNFPGCKTFTITENHRSGQRIVRTANRFASKFERASYEPMTPVKKEEGFVGIAANETPQEEAAWIADQVETLVKGGMRYSDIGILTRSVKTSAPPLVDVLDERGIPFLVGGKVGLFRRGEALALGLTFVWFCDKGFWRFEDNKVKVEGEALLTEAASAWQEAVGKSAPENLRENLDGIKKKLRSQKGTYRCFTSIFHDVLKAYGFTELDPNNKRHAAVMANLGRFNTMLTDYETANRIGGKTPHWGTHLEGLMWFMH